MIKNIFIHSILLLFFFSANTQPIDVIINVAEAERIEKILSADDMQGRGMFTPGIEKSAKFISAEFKKNNLSFWDTLHTYQQSFSIVNTKLIAATGTFNYQPVDSNKIITITKKNEPKIFICI